MHAWVVGSTCPRVDQGSQDQDQRYQTCYDESQAQMPAAAAWLEGLDIGVERTGLLLLMMMMRLQPGLHQEMLLAPTQQARTGQEGLRHSGGSQSRPMVPSTAQMP